MMTKPSLKEECCLKVMDEKCLSGPFRISLGGLYARKTRDRMTTVLAKQAGRPEERDTDKKNNQHRILCALLPAEYRLMPDGTDLANLKEASISRFFICAENPDTGKFYSERQYEAVGNNLIDLARKAGFRTGEFTLLPHIRGQLQIMLAELTENERRDFSADAMTLLERLKNKSKKYPDLASHAEGLKKLGTLEEQLAYLTVIALTWSCWSWNNDALTKDLAFLLLTPKKEGTEIQAIESWKEKRLAEDNDRSAKLLEQCRDAFRQKDFFTCGKAAEGILALRFAPDLVRAEAYYMLSVCCAEHGYKRSCPLPSPKELMLRAYKFGYAGAREVLLNKYGFDAAPLLLRPRAKALRGTARVVSNCINQYTKTVLQSAPDTLRKEADDALKKKEDAEKWVYCAPGKKALQDSVDFSQETRYLLFDDDQEKNFHDLLCLLDRIAAVERSNPVSPEQSTRHWSGTAIYLRASEDRYAALVDTAMKRLGQFVVKVFLIDDEKWAAQALLTRHPIYELIQCVSGKELKRGPFVINFTVICDRNAALASRLLREAYWLSTFSYPGLTVKFHLLSPVAQEIKNTMRLEFPAMFEALPDADMTSHVTFLAEDLTLPALSDYRLAGYVDKIEAMPNSFNYYVIDAGDDISSLNLAIRLREWNVRSCVAGRTPLQNGSQPRIAFYCKDPDIAYLAENMVVQTVDHGSSWYNNYNLISFGLLTDSYSWDAMDGGYWERVAESVHLQYCGIAWNAADDVKNENLVDYYARMYNRDSSMAAALYLPYQMFQIRTASAEHIVSDAPLGTVGSEDANAKLAHDMGDQFREAIGENSKALIPELVCIEHARWIRWAYSRGWKATTPDQVLFYMEEGNPKQQLYIARLHGCLCASQELAVLAEQMKQALTPDDGKQPHKNDWKRFAASREKDTVKLNNTDRATTIGWIYTPKDFAEFDRSHVLASAELIEARWIEHEPPTPVQEALNGI